MGPESTSHPAPAAVPDPITGEVSVPRSGGTSRRRNEVKDQAILALKGLAIIGVVSHHITNRRLDPTALEVLKAVPMAFHWCVLCFIALSGYLHALSDSRRPKGVGAFLWQRGTRLLIPWVVLVFLYATVWQVLQSLHISGIGVRIPPGFIDKLTTSLWPVDQVAVVAEQLYYLPLLFGASAVFICVRKLGLSAVWATLMLTVMAGLLLFPGQYMMFRLGSFVWAIASYAAGYLLFRFRTNVSHVRLTLAVATAVLIVYSGWYGLLGSIPFWLIAEGSNLRLGSIPGLASLGEAAGTIYIYHTPFMVQPLSVAAAHLPGWPLQVVGELVAGAIAIGICYLLHHGLKNTRAKFLLM